MDLSAIRGVLSTDYDKNHHGRSYSKEYVFDIFDKYVGIGGKFNTYPNVVITWKDAAGVCEFHCFNGGSGAELTSAINEFLKSIAVEYSRAATYYDNPRINDLKHYSVYPATVTKIDGGEDRTYEMVFDLRSA